MACFAAVGYLLLSGRTGSQPLWTVELVVAPFGHHRRLLVLHLLEVGSSAATALLEHFCDPRGASCLADLVRPMDFEVGSSCGFGRHRLGRHLLMLWALAAVEVLLNRQATAES